MELFHTGWSAGPPSFKGLPWAHATLLMASLSREAPHNVWGGASQGVRRTLMCIWDHEPGCCLQAQPLAPSASTTLGAVIEGTSPQNFFPRSIKLGGTTCQIQQMRKLK